MNYRNKMQQIIEESLKRLQEYAESQDYRGYDPYDGLNSPLFKLPLLRSSKLIRFGTQQLIKRLPLNLRPLLFIPKGLNPVTLGLFTQGYACLIKGYPEKEEIYRERISYLITKLEELIPPGFSGACWGYDFDWEARQAKIPAYQPTVVATGIITNALFIAWKNTGIEKCSELVKSAASFIIHDLYRSFEGNSFCFSYSPFDKQRVFNASMKGVRLLAQAYSITGDQTMKELARNAVDFIIQHQNNDGSWRYSLAISGDWVDNYHTGYVLDCLDEYIKLTGDHTYKENLLNGFRFYENHFIAKEGIPRFYSTNTYPIDCTAASQTILSLCRFGDIDLATVVAVWMIKNMQAAEGSFYFRKYQYFTERTPFMRWSNAWMFAALASLLVNRDQKSSIG